MRRDLIRAELLAMTICNTRMIAWEAITRWSESIWEIGTYRITANQRNLEGMLDRLCALRHVVEVTS